MNAPQKIFYSPKVGVIRPKVWVLPPKVGILLQKLENAS